MSPLRLPGQGRRHTPVPWEVAETEDDQWGVYAAGDPESLAEFDREADARFVCAAVNFFDSSILALKDEAAIVEEMRARLAAMTAALTARSQDLLDSVHALVEKMEEV